MGGSLRREREKILNELTSLLKEYGGFGRILMGYSKEQFLSEGIIKARRFIDSVLDAMLKLYGEEGVSLKDVKMKVYSFEGDLDEFLEWFVGIFNVDLMRREMGVDRDELLVLLFKIGRHFWLINPHERLSGRSPVEVMVSGDLKPGVILAASPVFEYILLRLMECGVLPHSTARELREIVYESGGKEGVKEKVKSVLAKCLAADFSAGSITELRELVGWIVEMAWKFYPQKDLGDRSPIQTKISGGCEWTENGGKCGKPGEYVCMNCGEILCFAHTTLHILKHESEKWPHVLWRVDNYEAFVERVVERVKGD